MHGKEITHQINLFREFLVSCWSSFDNLMENHDWENDGYFTIDWIQVNWELLVEREILGKGQWLTPLSISEYRVLNKGVKSNYSVVTILPNSIFDLRSGKMIPDRISLRLIEFCTSLEQGGYGLYPPFDIVVLIDDNKKPKEIYTTPLAGLSFFLGMVQMKVTLLTGFGMKQHKLIKSVTFI